MSNHIFAGGLGVAALLVAVPAFASTPQASASGQGHFEWRAGTQAGPRGPLSPPRRVWVPSDADRMASCDCAMMRVRPETCGPTRAS
ncbi:hypothetical protein ACVWZA_003648 [Sphingomonas sp. UYAg733]